LHVERWFRKLVLSRRSTTFAVMGVAFLVFGAGTVNLFMLLKRNFDLITDYGLQALADGGLLQLVELVVIGYLSLIAYVVFKACEHALVHHLTDDDHAD